MAFKFGSQTMIWFAYAFVIFATVTAFPSAIIKADQQDQKPDLHPVGSDAHLEKREAPQEDQYMMDKKSFGMGASGFHGDTFSNGFGQFSTMKRNPFGGGARGFHGDAFSNGFGEFSTMRKKKFGGGSDSAFHGRSAFSGGFGDFSTMRKRFMGPSGFHGDTFSQGFGGFSTMKRANDRQAYESQVAAMTLAALLDSIERGEVKLRAPEDED